MRASSGKQLEVNGYPLVEVEPVLFFAPDGEVLDFRGAIPTGRNIRLEKDNGTLLPHGGLHFEQQIGFSMVYATAGLTLVSVIGLSFSWGAGFGTPLNCIWSSVIAGMLDLFCLLVVL